MKQPLIFQFSIFSVKVVLEKRHSEISLLDEPLLRMRVDFILQYFYFGRKWTVIIHC